MGQKVCPIGFRLGITQGWKSVWYADKKSFGSLLIEDFKIRKLIKKNYSFGGIPFVEIERTRQEAKITLHTARPATATRSVPAPLRHSPYSTASARAETASSGKG